MYYEYANDKLTAIPTDKWHTRKDWMNGCGSVVSGVNITMSQRQHTKLWHKALTQVKVMESLHGASKGSYERNRHTWQIYNGYLAQLYQELHNEIAARHVNGYTQLV